MAVAGMIDEDLASMDPKRAKRLVANRQVSTPVQAVACAIYFTVLARKNIHNHGYSTLLFVSRMFTDQWVTTTAIFVCILIWQKKLSWWGF